MQISPNAEADTIQRVYRFLAVRLHPDNPETGNAEKFYQLKEAYDVLSDPMRRQAYDVAIASKGPEEEPLSTTIDFMDDIEGELNRRLAVLAVLYIRRRTYPDLPEVSLHEVEKRLGFPRDYLEFTIWYLRKKGFITRADNSDFTLTADGVDFVETQRVNIPVLQKMLTNGTDLYTTGDFEGSDPKAWVGHRDRRRKIDRRKRGLDIGEPDISPLHNVN
jgi:curved DNA-binding protein CbpA